MNAKLLIGLGLLLGLGLPAAQAQFIWIKVSVKVVLNSDDGLRPAKVTDAHIDEYIARINELEAFYSRGFRFWRVDPVTPVGAQGDTTGPSRWFSVNFFDPDNGTTWKDQMESAAKNDSAYHWNNEAINIYITAGICGGICSFPEGSERIVVFGLSSTSCGAFAAAQGGETLLHEIGHYFGLYHTQGKSCGCCGSGNGLCNTPGDDEINDTLPDLPCWDQNMIARNHFGRSYDDPMLTPFQREQVDNVFFNIMSYHASGCGTLTSVTRLTEKQLDRWGDIANGPRRGVTTGRTWFVDYRNSCLFTDGSSECTLFGGPHTTVAGALNDANARGGDIILIRPGSYNQRLTVTKPVTLRATSQGPVTIGR
jgi:hypothetical protein